MMMILTLCDHASRWILRLSVGTICMEPCPQMLWCSDSLRYRLCRQHILSLGLLTVNQLDIKRRG